MTIEQTLQLAWQHFQAGRLQQAEKSCHDVLAGNPNQPDALHLLGIIAGQCKQYPLAIDLIRRAIVNNPRAWAYHGSLGNVLKSAGRTSEAIAEFRALIELKADSADGYTALGNALQDAGELDQAIAAHQMAVQVNPNFFTGYSNLGNVLIAKGELDRAIEALRAALRINDKRAEIHYNLGVALKGKGDIEQAIAAYRAAIALQPNYAKAYNNLGSAVFELGQVDQAIVHYQHAIQHQNNFAEAYANLGLALAHKSQTSAAIEAFRSAARLAPDNPSAHFNLGDALETQGELEAAVAEFREAIRLRPDYLDASNNLATAIAALGQTDEAISLLRATIERDPKHASAHANLGILLLLKGEYREGWREHEWRNRRPNYVGAREFSKPRWDGSDVRGKTILLHENQGFGDTIQLTRFVPPLIARGAKVVLECHPELVRLLKDQWPIEQCISHGQTLPDFDVHCPLLSLPFILDTTLQSIPDQAYLRPDFKLAEQWKRLVENDSSDLKVGLAWAGNAALAFDRFRSIDPTLLKPLLAIEGVRFYSLQLGQTPPKDFDLIDFTHELNDFADTAAMVANLDLVITVDTAVAHLTGALGKPVWMMARSIPEWRWLLNRSDSPWYPSMRIFRQTAFGDWKGTVDRVGAALREFRENPSR